MDIQLLRLTHKANGIHGILTMNGAPLCLTLERPWLDNQRNISCIPPGEYDCVKHYGLKYKNVWRLENVPNRSGILIHQGNSILNTAGCILVGMGIDRGGFISDSQRALDLLRKTLDDEFILNILNVYKGV